MADEITGTNTDGQAPGFNMINPEQKENFRFAEPPPMDMGMTPPPPPPMGGMAQTPETPGYYGAAKEMPSRRLEVDSSDRPIGTLYYIGSNNRGLREVKEILDALDGELEAIWVKYKETLTPENDPIEYIALRKDGIGADFVEVGFKSGLLIQDMGRIVTLEITPELLRAGLLPEQEIEIAKDIKEISDFLNARCGKENPPTFNGYESAPGIMLKAACNGCFISRLALPLGKIDLGKMQLDEEAFVKNMLARRDPATGEPICRKEGNSLIFQNSGIMLTIVRNEEAA